MGTNQDTGKAIPIKKLFVNNNKIIIDEKSIDDYEYMKTPNPMKNFLQKSLDMPLDTMRSLNLPNKIVASNAPKPYVVIYGMLSISKKKDITMGSIILGFKDRSIAKMSIPDLKREINQYDTIFNINKENYLINDTTLYQKYHSNKILVDDHMSSELFANIANTFFDYVCSKDFEFIRGKTTFNLYVLPSSHEITLTTEQSESSKECFIDSFGNSSEKYPDKPTQGVTFCSYDDNAFTINCKKKEEFYESLNIGSKSLDKIILPENKKINIQQFEWYFFNIEDPKMVFEEQFNGGILSQLYHNYCNLKKNKADVSKLQNLIVICIKKTNAKREVLINENLSMQKLDLIFGIYEQNDIPFFALESLIIKKHKTAIFTHYVRSIKSVLNQTNMDKHTLVNIYTTIIHNKAREWLEQTTFNEPITFFKQSEFCIKTLKNDNDNDFVLESASLFAKQVGAMTRQYVEFRRSRNLENNSYRTILTKNVYTIPVLQDVVKQIGRSLHLLKLDNDVYHDIVDKLSEITPKDIGDNPTRDDLSYYYYMGYFGSKKD